MSDAGTATGCGEGDGTDVPDHADTSTKRIYCVTHEFSGGVITLEGDNSSDHVPDQGTTL